MKIEDIKQLNIYEKISLIADEIGVIEKNLKIDVTKTRSYKAVSERDVIDAVKPLEKKYRVYSYPITRELIDKDILVKETDYGVTQSLFMRLKTIYRFVNIDKTDDYIETIVYGDGIDTGDKAPGKAMTYADKYALMKAYKLSTGDDPDKEASPEKGYKTKETGKEQQETLELLGEIRKIMNEKKILPNEISEHFGKTSNEMTNEELKEVIEWLGEQ